MEEWYVRSAEGSVYGPTDRVSLVQWAREGRIDPSGYVSRDRKSWLQAPLMPDLEMTWVVETDPGKFYGPFNRAVVVRLAAAGSIPAGANIYRRHDLPPDQDPAPERIEVPVEKVDAKEVRVEVPVEKIVEKEVRVEVPVEKVVEKVVEKEVRVEVPVEKIVEKEVRVEVPVEKVVEKEVRVEVPVEKIVEKEVRVEVPVEKIVEKEVRVEVPVEKIVEKVVEKEVRVEVPVEKVVEKIVRVEVPVEKIVERVIEVAPPPQEVARAAEVVEAEGVQMPQPQFGGIFKGADRARMAALEAAARRELSAAKRGGFGGMNGFFARRKP